MPCRKCQYLLLLSHDHVPNCGIAKGYLRLFFEKGVLNSFEWMDQNVDFSIIIPTLNEELNISPLLQEIFSVFQELSIKNFEIFFVDDNSKDSTIEKINSFHSQNITVIKRPQKMGIGSAYKEAFPMTKGKFIVIMDADLSHPPKALKKFNNIIKMRQNSNKSTENLVISSTRYDKGGSIIHWSKKRIFISKLANFIGKTLLRISSSDLTGSYRLYSRQLFSEIAKVTKSNGFSFQLEAIFYATRFKAEIEEVPITFMNREKGTSKLDIEEIINFCLTLIRLFFVLILYRF